ncbi:MAG: barstar family protein [Terriglobales bacterium]
MKDIILDGARWSTKDDVYDAFFRAAGAPEWHGRNFDALRDSIAGGSINQVEVPYCLVIKNYDKISGEAKRMADDFIDLIHELAAEGCQVEVRAEVAGGARKRSGIQQSRLDELEAEFKQSLIQVLKECAAGRWGLFGQNDHLEEGRYLSWPVAEDLRRRAKQIHIVRLEFGQPNSLVERFLHYCSLRGANVPGEPKLAKTFLDEIRT